MVNKNVTIIPITVDSQHLFVNTNAWGCSIAEEIAISGHRRREIFRIFEAAGCHGFGDVVCQIMKRTFEKALLQEIVTFQEDSFVMPPIIVEAANAALKIWD